MRKTLLTLGLCGLAFSTTGCSVWKTSSSTKKSKEPWSITKLWKKEYQQPQSMAVIWAPDVLMVPGSTPTRGFGGRIYFYNELSQAVPVDGDLMVHGYLKQNPRADVSEQISADKTFAFTAEQLTTHFSPSEIGASYSIWVPWDSADGERTEVTLIPTFKGKQGSVVQGTPTKVNLPGKKPDGEEAMPKVPMQTVSYSRMTIPTNPGDVKPQMKTTTIAVPPNASIGRPRSQPTFTLPSGENGVGAQSNDQTVQPVSSSGVTVGGGSIQLSEVGSATDQSLTPSNQNGTARGLNERRPQPNLHKPFVPPKGVDPRAYPSTIPASSTGLSSPTRA